MGTLITVASQKGGVGKTTTALNLGYSLSRLGFRVLIVDGDPQGGIENASNLRLRASKGLLHVLKEECTPWDIVTRTKQPGLSIAGVGIGEAEDTIFFEKAVANGGLEAAFLAYREHFDCVIIDAPAGSGMLVSAWLELTDAVILPLPCQALSLKSLPTFLRLIKHTRATSNPELRLEGVLITMMRPRNSPEAEAYEEIKGQLPGEIFFDTVIPYNKRFEIASTRSLPVALLDGAERLGRSYMRLANELKDRISKDQDDGNAYTEGLF